VPTFQTEDLEAKEIPSLGNLLANLAFAGRTSSTGAGASFGPEVVQADAAVMADNPDEILPAWEELDLSQVNGILMVVGASDVGKSTFARYLFRRLSKVAGPVAYLDGDPGQSTLGPPSTMTLALNPGGEDDFPPTGIAWRGFVGSVSPAGHMLPLLTAAARLTEAARKAGAKTIVYDTTGLVDPARGGISLKLAKIDLLRPSVLVAIHRARELEPLLAPLRRSRRVRVLEFVSSPAARQREREERQEGRANRFADYFRRANHVLVNWFQFAVFPAPRFHLHRLLALEDQDGFALSLGIVVENDRISRRVLLRSSLSSMSGVDAIRLGDLVVDPETFRDQPLSLVEREQFGRGR
jgi:polynucleotide 5'-kinase involved in rRNA processing